MTLSDKTEAEQGGLVTPDKPKKPKDTKSLTKDELFAKYHISGGHQQWDNAIDNWYSVEIYRQMHNGELPPPDDMSITYVLDFIDKTADLEYFFSLPNAGSFYTTAHRMVYRYADQILTELNGLVATDKDTSND